MCQLSSPHTFQSFHFFLYHVPHCNFHPFFISLTLSLYEHLLPSSIMRLLSTKDFTFHEFPEDAVPSYAILSHTWDGDEVTLQDMQRPNAKAVLQSRSLPNQSWKKVQDACSMAYLKGFQHIWIDNCCIDKTNSAELQEAINSMFRWYRNSSLCLALLSDVYKSNFDLNEELQSYATFFCRWFTRGWILQELLAPRYLIFFDADWRELGSRSEWSSQISKATGIHGKFLLGIELDPCKAWDLEAVLRDTSVATKMSWAAGRQTTRIEDQAYCLLGLFDIHMPMLYGEGRKAFARLQQEIMKSTDDCTLLAWGYNEPLHGAPISEIPFYCRCCRCHERDRNVRRTTIPEGLDLQEVGTLESPFEPPHVRSHIPPCAYADVTSGPQGGVLGGHRLCRDLYGHNFGGRPRPLFAPSPKDFGFAGNLEPCGIPGHRRPTFALGQRGLDITLPVARDDLHEHIVYGLLACSPKLKTKPASLVALPLIRASVIDAASKDRDDEYVQSPYCLPCKVPVSFAEKAQVMSICIRPEDRYRRLWDSVGYLERSLMFDFGHPFATKEDMSTLRIELMYPPQPMCSMYFTLFRHSCPIDMLPCAPTNRLEDDWWWCHLPRPPPRSRALRLTGHPWDEKIHNKVQYTPNTTIAAMVLNFNPNPLHAARQIQSEQFPNPLSTANPVPLDAGARRPTRLLLVVSSDLFCRARKLSPDTAITLEKLMEVAKKPDMASPRLKFEEMGDEHHEWWKEALVVCKLPGGIELCLRTWW
ncbi:heterokaryon incompatibility protein-domain-containing protein [Sordaria brevicollis]|uniref:Heterokaryon incompatibility protein-domain-containing protein n=1 Tax=Sordaria brevicollis TaxID=83679 RepID=A0AAE0PIW3_SORBR|nr:heterokaryon incompatibility protein-domain-containing protein [Sordaria brevicollis]